ncbi:TIGR00341 family protein, partial [Pseudomonadota bacterium]
MLYRIIEVHLDKNNIKVLDAISEQKSIIDYWKDINTEGRAKYSFLVRSQDVQKITDAIETTLGYTKTIRIIVLNVEATLPKIEELTTTKDKNSKTSECEISREELYSSVSKNSNLSSTFLLLIFLSSIVAAIGMIQGSITTIIGAMVIAPLLGPIIGFSFSIATNNEDLTSQSLKTIIFSFIFCIIVSIIIGLFWRYFIGNDIYITQELMDRTTVDFYDITLALVSGGAAALSVTSGVSSALVGVMVAVAILPPLCASGIMFGFGNILLGLGALHLSLVNLVCVNISAQIMFLFKKIWPRVPEEKVKAKNIIIRNLIISIIILILLSGGIYHVED